MSTTEKETGQTQPKQEAEPTPSFVTGDVVTLKHTNDLGRIWLLTTPAKDVPGVGLEVGAVELNKDGHIIALDGTIEMSNIREAIGERKSPEEIKQLYLDYFESNYGDTIPRAEVVAMVAKNLGVPNNELT